MGTKYIETQKDPFSTLFVKFRGSLKSKAQNIFVTSGYSFGDDHINAEIKSAITCPDNQTTLIVFIDNASSTPLDWLEDEELSKKIFIATKEGIYHRSNQIIKKEGEGDLAWWTFKGLTGFLKGEMV